MPRKSQSEKEREIIAEAIERYSDYTTSESFNSDAMTLDLRFCYEPGAQWEQQTLAMRIGRPNYTYNRVVQSVNQVVGDQRQARITGKVRAVNKDASKEMADIFGGIIRNIEACSGAQYIYSDQFKYAVAGGWGAWRICPEYAGDDTFEQELYIKGLSNPQTARWDPSATCPCKSDAAWAIVSERVSKAAYEAMGGDPDAVASFPAVRDGRDWISDGEVRVAEDWKRTSKERTIAELSDGRVIEYDASVKKVEDLLTEMAEAGLPVPTITRTRKTKAWTVTWWKMSATEVLEGPIEYKWKRIPVIRLPGRYVNIDGRQYVQSLIRHSKDAQRTYNYNRSTMVEAAALTPRAPYVVSDKMIVGYEDEWNTANKVNRPYLRYKADPSAPNARPTREPPPDVPQALIALAAADAEDIKQTTGQVNPSLTTADGAGDESGVAVRNRLLAGGSNAYEFTDNLQRAVQITHEMLIDMIPTVYDTERTVRVVGEDEVEDYITVNQITPDGVMNALAKGSYDVTVTIGPAYATARQESTDRLMEATGVLPVIGEVGADIIVKNLDIEDSDELRKRIRKRYIAQGIIEPTPEEAQEMGPPPPPDPVQVAMVERLQAQTQRDAASAAKTQAEVQMIPLELEERIAEIVNTRLESLKKAGELAMTGSQTVAAERRSASAPRSERSMKPPPSTRASSPSSE